LFSVMCASSHAFSILAPLMPCCDKRRNSQNNKRVSVHM
jgi:hypothetical protein